MLPMAFLFSSRAMGAKLTMALFLGEVGEKWLS
jgi:hypothetical protein